MTHRTRPRVTVTLDPDLLGAVDDYVQEHHRDGADRSGVLDEALRLWCQERLRRAMRAQYLAPRSDEELDEQASWTHIRDTSHTDFIRRFDDHEAT